MTIPPESDNMVTILIHKKKKSVKNREICCLIIF